MEMCMRTTKLATALALARVHGVQFAAAYLCEAGISIDVAIELLAAERCTCRFREHDAGYAIEMQSSDLQTSTADVGLTNL